MIPGWHSVAEPFSRGQSACEQFAGQLGDIAVDLEGTAGLPLRMTGMLRALRRAEAALRRPLRLAVLGEANAGKSTLVNLMLGNAVIPTLQLSNTRVPTLLHYAPQPAVAALMADGSRAPLVSGSGAPSGMVTAAVGLPVAHLRSCEIMDFPGFSDPWLGYEAQGVIRHGIDASIWCTFSTQAWKESEKAVWSRLPGGMRVRALLTVTYKDLLRGVQAEKVMARLAKLAAPDFRGIVLLSSQTAQKALDPAGAVKDRALWQESGAADLFEAVGSLLAELRRDRLRRVQAFAGRIAAWKLDHLGVGGKVEQA